MLSEIGNDYQDYDVIGIDEGQFFKDVSEVENLKFSVRPFQTLTLLF